MVNKTVAKEKATYEEKKDQERKRRFALLSGNLKPIKTSLHLNAGEHSYFAFQTSRMADRDYIESHTKGAGIGEGFGRVGVGIAKSTTTQERVTKLETVDTGTLLFTNKRILFVGKEVVSVAYQDILATEFDGTTMIIKYPNMIKNECYDIEKESDAAVYFNGLMRLLGRDKSKIKEADIDMSDYPEFVPPPKEKIKKKMSLRNKIFIWIGVLLFMAIFLKGLIQPSIIIDVIVIICSVMALPILWVMNLFTKNHYAVEVQQFKRIFLWSISILICLIIMNGITSTSTTNAPATNTKAIQAKMQAQKKEEAQVAAYREETMPIIQQFEAEDTIIEADKSKQDLRTDTVYIQAAKVYDNLNKELLNAKVATPDSYSDYGTFLAWITGDMSDAMDNIVGNDGSSQINGFSMLEVGTCEADIKIAAEMSPTYQGSDADTTYNGYGGKIDDLENVATGKL